jgi:hypothetical protein
MKHFIALAILVIMIGGCVAVPFQETELVPLSSEPARNMAEHFQTSIPDVFQVLSTVVFEYNGRSFGSIGSVEINRSERSFLVAGMNPMGVKLFEISGNERTGATLRYAIADFTKYGDIALAVGSDIKRIYLDLVPGPEAKSWKRKYKLIFRQPWDAGFVEYVFAGSNGDLIEKNYYDSTGLAWRVSYYEYREQQGKRWPQGILMMHFDYGYRLTIRQKEFHA